MKVIINKVDWKYIWKILKAISQIITVVVMFRIEDVLLSLLSS